MLHPAEVEQLLKARHRPNYCLQVISEILKAARLPTAPHMRMEANVTEFEDCLGACERILRTPVPLSYTRHTTRFLMIWLTLLPFALVGACGAATVPLCAVVGYLLLGVEEIGNTIEEPFSILPLETISGTILDNARELAAANGAAGVVAAGAAGADALPAPAEAVVVAGLAATAAVVGGDGASVVPRALQPAHANGNGNGHANGHAVSSDGNGSSSNGNSSGGRYEVRSPSFDRPAAAFPSSAAAEAEPAAAGGALSTIEDDGAASGEDAPAVLSWPAGQRGWRSPAGAAAEQDADRSFVGR